jgi:hypothetical protein
MISHLSAGWNSLKLLTLSQLRFSNDLKLHLLYLFWLDSIISRSPQFSSHTEQKYPFFVVRSIKLPTKLISSLFHLQSLQFPQPFLSGIKLLYLPNS